MKADGLLCRLTAYFIWNTAWLGEVRKSYGILEFSHWQRSTKVVGCRNFILFHFEEGDIFLNRQLGNKVSRSSGCVHLIWKTRSNAFQFMDIDFFNSIICADHYDFITSVVWSDTFYSENAAINLWHAVLRWLHLNEHFILLQLIRNQAFEWTIFHTWQIAKRLNNHGRIRNQTNQ